MLLLISFLKQKERHFLESLLLDIFLLLMKLWLWELFRQKESLLSKNLSRIKMKVLELQQLGVWDRWEDIHLIMLRL